jgi:AMMECR1 domain-containing protein
VDVLGKVEKAASWEELDVKKYGVIVSNENGRGLLLPNLDGVETVQEQIAIARQKAGIGEQEEIELERFQVERHF